MPSSLVQRIRIPLEVLSTDCRPLRPPSYPLATTVANLQTQPKIPRTNGESLAMPFSP